MANNQGGYNIIVNQPNNISDLGISQVNVPSNQHPSDLNNVILPNKRRSLKHEKVA